MWQTARQILLSGSEIHRQIISSWRAGTVTEESSEESMALHRGFQWLQSGKGIQKGRTVMSNIWRQELVEKRQFAELEQGEHRKMNCGWG